MMRAMCMALLGLLLAGVAKGQIVTSPPAGVSDVGIVEHRGEMLPQDLKFRDSTGKRVLFGDYFDGKRPVILSFNYSSCPMLCKLQLNGLVQGLSELAWDAGDEFRVVSISIDPSETSRQAAAVKQQHLNAYGRSGTGNGWTFLTGDPEDICRAADAAGFQYKYLPKQREYSHAAALMVCTPDGRLSQYLYGVKFDQQTLRLALTQAGSGEVGSALDQLLLFCFSYDRKTGKYTPVAKNVMRAGALATVAALTICVAPFWFRSRRRSSTNKRSASVHTTTGESV